MDRDRDRDRTGRPFPREDQYGTGRGQSYRPGGRSPLPPQGDNFRSNRSPPPRGGGYGDSYGAPRPPVRGRSRSPPPFRRRSRTPPFRGRDGDNFRARPRSPPRRDFARDSRDMAFRGPPRDYRDDRGFSGRSPVRPQRARSPIPPMKRSRDISPVSSRGRMASPPPKRERLNSPQRPRYEQYPPSREVSPPRRGYSPPSRRPSPPRGIMRDWRAASRSPLRRPAPVDPRTVDNWRRRSPSPLKTRPDHMSAENSGRDSANTSRRSSPPVHPSRLAVIDPDARPARPPPTEVNAPAQPSYRTRSPPPPARSPLRRRDSPPRDLEYSQNSQARAPPPSTARYDEPAAPRAPPTGPAGARSQAPPQEVAPPTGPSRAPPTGPRPNGPSAPSGPSAVPSGPSNLRAGAPAPSRGGYRGDFPPRGDFAGAAPRGRGSFGGAYRGRGGGPAPAYGREYDAPSGPPAGPRGSHAPPPPFRQGSNTTSGTYPRTQRFAPNGAPIPEGPRDAPNGPRKPSHPHLAGLPQLVEGGQKAPELYDRLRAERLEDEAEKLRRVIDEKQARKRKGLREWEKLERESEQASFRATLADESVRMLAGEVDGGAAF